MRRGRAQAAKAQAVAAEAAWLCRCRFPDGRTETTSWLTEDGADQMASEMETHEGAQCAITPTRDAR